MVSIIFGGSVVFEIIYWCDKKKCFFKIFKVDDFFVLNFFWVF